MTMTELTDKQRLAIEHLLNGESVTETADAVGVSRQTLYEWQRQPMFHHELELQRADRQTTFRERWERMGGKVSDVVESALDADDMDTKLKAVSLWLKHQAPTPETLAPFDPTLATVEFAREEMRREIVREFTLEGKPLIQHVGWNKDALQALCDGTVDLVDEEVKQRLPDRLRELELHA